MLIAGVILLSYHYFTNGRRLSVTKGQLYYIFFVAVFGIYLTNACEFWGLKYVSAGKTCLICCFYPIVTALIAWLSGKEVLTTKKIIGLLIGMLGFIPVLMIEGTFEELSGTCWWLSYAELALIFSTFATALGWIFSRHAIKELQLNVVLLNGASMSIGGIMALVHSYAAECWDPLPIYNMRSFLLWLMVIIFCSNIVSYNLHGFLLKKFTATYISFANLIDPLFASIFGWLILGEVLHYQFWLSFIFVVFGSSLYYKESIRLRD